MTAIGIDLCGDYTSIHIYGKEDALLIPTVICRDKDAELFSIGEEAYRRTLTGGGVLVDKLLRLAAKDGTATIGGVCYRARQLLGIFLTEAVKEALLQNRTLREMTAEPETAEGELLIASLNLSKETEVKKETGSSGETVSFSQTEAAAAAESAVSAKAVKAVLREDKNTDWRAEVSELCVTLPELSENELSAAREALDLLGLPKKRVHILSHTEAMMYYVLSREKEFYNSTVALFNLSEEKLFYYEMKVLRGLQKINVAGDGVPMDEGFNIDILKSEAGRKLGDNILFGCAEKMMAKKNYSSVFLTGKGFEEIDYFPQFKEFICRRRRACTEKALFARGASEAAFDRTREQTAFPYVFLCESRLRADISLNVVTKNREERLMLASAGDAWSDIRGRIEFIPHKQDYIDIDISPADRILKRKTVRIPLQGFPERPDRCTRISLEVSFRNAEHMHLCLKDKGLGELFPKSDVCIYEEIEI